LRSCAYGFTVKRNLAYSYLPVELKPGAQVEVEVFGELVPATVMRDRVLEPEPDPHEFGGFAVNSRGPL
jgi:glycine cleavage system aminomethyltransferase T